MKINSSWAVGDSIIVSYKFRGRTIRIEEARVQAVAENALRVRFCKARLLQKLFRSRVKWIPLDDPAIVVTRCSEI